MSSIELLYEELVHTPPPDVVYHYTSPAGVLGMISGNKIWATDVRYMNDAQEFDYARGVINPILRKRTADAANASEQRLYEQFDGILEVAPTIHTYAASFSAEADLLSQWRAYCPPSGGFAVGFVPHVLMKTTVLTDSVRLRPA